MAVSVLTALLILSPCSKFEASAQQVSDSYNVQHSFWFWPGWWPIWPGNPPWWFMPRGIGWDWANAAAWTPAVGLVQQSDGQIAMMPPRLNIVANAVADSDGSHADAHGSVTLQPGWGFQPFWPWGWGLMRGTLRAWGTASVQPGSGFGAWTSANSGASVFMWGGFVWWRWWWIRWQPFLWSSVSGHAWARRIDPINYQIFDQYGNLAESNELMHITLDGTGDHQFDWSTNGVITVTPSTNSDSVLTWEMSIQNPPESSYVTNAHVGFLRLTFTAGAVTESTQSGQFASWSIPSVGTTGTVQIIAQEINMGVDFGSNVDAGVILGGAAEPEQSAPVFDATPTLGAYPLAVRAWVASSSTNGALSVLSWGDGTTNYSSSPYRTTHVYASPGTYAMTLMIDGTSSTHQVVVLDGNADAFGKGMSNQDQLRAGIDPTTNASFFRVTGMAVNGNDVVVTWRASGSDPSGLATMPLTNWVQASPGTIGSGFTNNFRDVSSPIVISNHGDCTMSYVDTSARTNGPYRYYRIRCGP
ncbi:MAG TPA: hypothetical protein VMV72_09240 [Verrucomicrobiae bacterium]|nr:hypothetical protein [Verrucomicrobiae bacterium]